MKGLCHVFAGRKLPVVILTTSRSEEDVLTSSELHGNCCITKPVNLDRFIDVVRRCGDFRFTVVELTTATREEKNRFH